MNKILKLLSILGGITVILGGINFVLFPWIYFGERQIYVLGGFKDVIRTTLNIPYVLKSSQIIKSNLEDLEEITDDEWMSMQCECPDTLSGQYYKGLNISTTMKLEKLDIKLQKHIWCISPQIFTRASYLNKMPINCSSIFNCPSIRVYMNEYVLKYPKVLNNLIKIVEKPCFYLKHLPLKPGEYSNTDPLSNPTHLIKQRREELYCDKTKVMFYEKDVTFSEIIIIDSNDRVKLQILVPRKDNAHLIKK